MSTQVEDVDEIREGDKGTMQWFENVETAKNNGVWLGAMRVASASRLGCSRKISDKLLRTAEKGIAFEAQETKT